MTTPSTSAKPVRALGKRVLSLLQNPNVHTPLKEFAGPYKGVLSAPDVSSAEVVRGVAATMAVAAKLEQATSSDETAYLTAVYDVCVRWLAGNTALRELALLGLHGALNASSGLAGAARTHFVKDMAAAAAATAATAKTEAAVAVLQGSTQ